MASQAIVVGIGCLASRRCDGGLAHVQDGEGVTDGNNHFFTENFFMDYNTVGFEL